jgi:hypothetical protein
MTGGNVTVRATGRVTIASVFGPAVEVRESASLLDPPASRPVRTASGGVLGLVFGSDATAQTIIVVSSGSAMIVRRT